MLSSFRQVAVNLKNCAGLWIFSLILILTAVYTQVVSKKNTGLMQSHVDVFGLSYC